MVNLLRTEDAQAFWREIHRSVFQNPYIYIDALTLGLQSEQTNTWVVADDGPIAFIFRYYNTVQLFFCGPSAKLNACAFRIAGFLSQYDFDMISGEAALIRSVSAELKGYRMTEGVIMARRECPTAVSEPFELAAPEDCPEIAALICSDEAIGGHYRAEQLACQLRGRMLHEHCRNLIVRRDGRIAAHFGTYAETKEFAVLGGLITHPDFRGEGLGRALQDALSGMLLKEEKLPLLYCFEETTRNWYARFGWSPITNCAKLEKRKETADA